MNANLSPDSDKWVEGALAEGQYRDANQFVETAVRYFLDQCQRGQQRLEALRRLGRAVDGAGIYDRVLLPDQE